MASEMAAEMDFLPVPQNGDELHYLAFPGDGMPTWTETMKAIEEHVKGKSTTKYGDDKTALFPTVAQVSDIKVYLQMLERNEDTKRHCPQSLRGEGRGEGEAEGKNEAAAQWRFSTKSKYELGVGGYVWSKGLKRGYVVPREQMHKVLVWAHMETGHGGRDKMYNLIKKRYCESSFPKAFVGEWPAHCSHQKCLKKPRGAKKGKTTALKPRVTAQTQAVAQANVNGPPQIQKPLTPEYDPSPAVDFPANTAVDWPGHEPDKDIISVWSGMPIAAIMSLQVPKSVEGLFTAEELQGLPPPREPTKVTQVIPTAAAVETNAMDVEQPIVESEADIDFDVNQFINFTTDGGVFAESLDF
ncbi:hypothetical protein MMC11_002366 [Xylographa trunciseda]|nr:hypothetical protein [Xylographa trunciseda]